MTVPLCVKCGSAAAQKVSAVYHAGVYTSHTSGHRFGYHRDKKGRWQPDVRPYSEQTTHKSRLAEMLSPPSRPVFWAGFAPFVLLGLLCFGWLLCSQSLTRIMGATLAQSVSFLILCFALVCVSGWLWEFEKRQYRDYKVGLAAWKDACRKWAEFYYCAACDTVFDPASGKAAPSVSMETLF